MLTADARGIFTIAPTPFTDAGALDARDLQELDRLLDRLERRLRTLRLT